MISASDEDEDEDEDEEEVNGKTAIGLWARETTGFHIVVRSL